jgi:hypothetical protein
MNRLDRIFERLPRIYDYREEDAIFFKIMDSISQDLDEFGKGLVDLMKSHWVDSASQEDLDSLGSMLQCVRIMGEDDKIFRARLKRTVKEYIGGGTVSAIEESVRALIRAKERDEVVVIEHPQTARSEEFRVMSGDTWSIDSLSIHDELPTITIIVEEEGEVNKPTIMNTETNESITYSGVIKSGQRLTLSSDHSELDEEDMTKQVSCENFPHLLRAGSTWKYSESLSGVLGVFDSSKFDEHTFTKGVPYVGIYFEWTSNPPATFEVQVKSDALARSGIDEKSIKDFIDIKKG